MKDHLPLEWQELPRYESASLWKTMRRSAREHGYRSFLWFGLVRLKDHWFNNWAQKAPWGGVRKWLQRQRGVKTTTDADDQMLALGMYKALGQTCCLDVENLLAGARHLLVSGNKGMRIDIAQKLKLFWRSRLCINHLRF